MINFREIRKLVKLLEDSEISEIEIEEKDFKIHLIKRNFASRVVVSQSVEGVATNTSAISQNQGTKSEEKNLPENIKIQRAPMVGTFYAAPAPEAEPYVRVGDHVTKGQTLCIIEAMKLMNEIESDFNGQIVEIKVGNAQPVQFDDELFYIQEISVEKK